MFITVLHVTCNCCLFRVLKFAVSAALLTYIVIDIAVDSPRNLISVVGLLVFILIFYITSTNPSKVCENRRHSLNKYVVYLPSPYLPMKILPLKKNCCLGLKDNIYDPFKL